MALHFHLYCLVYVIYWCLNSSTDRRIVWKFYFNVTTYCSFISAWINLNITTFSETFTKNNYKFQLPKVIGLHRPVQLSTWYQFCSFVSKVECFQKWLEFESNIFSSYFILGSYIISSVMLNLHHISTVLLFFVVKVFGKSLTIIRKSG